MDNTTRMTRLINSVNLMKSENTRLAQMTFKNDAVKYCKNAPKEVKACKL